MKIPKKWCIKLKDRKVEKIVGKWFNDNVEINCTYDAGWLNWYLHYPKYLSGTCTNLNPMPGYTEITFEEFEKYILHKQPDVPEDYKYLTTFLKKLKIK